MSKKTERVLEQNLEPGVCSHENWYVNLSFKRQRTKSHFHYLRFDIDLVWWLWIQMVWSKRMPWAPIFSWNVIRASQWENFAPEKLDHKNYLKFLFEFQLKDLLFSSSSPFFSHFVFNVIWVSIFTLHHVTSTWSNKMKADNKQQLHQKWH